MYALSVVVLIVTIQDGKIMWYEALVLVLTYLIYIAGKFIANLHFPLLSAADVIFRNFPNFLHVLIPIVMYWNDIMSQKARTIVAKIRRQSRVRPYRERVEITPLLAKVGTNGTSNGVSNGASNGISNGKSQESRINIQHRLYPIVETYEGKFYGSLG